MIYKILLIFFTFTSIKAGTSFFSIDDGTINVKDSSFYIYLRPSLSSKKAQQNILQSAVRLIYEKNSTIHTPKLYIQINSSNNSIKITPVEFLENETRYTLYFYGSRLSDNQEAYQDKKISFISSKFSKIAIEDKNISLYQGESDYLGVKLDEFNENTLYKIRSSSKKIRLYPSQVFFTRINYKKYQKIRISRSIDKSFDDTFVDINFTHQNTRRNISKRIYLKDKLKFVTNTYIHTQNRIYDYQLKFDKLLPKDSNITVALIPEDSKIISIQPSKITINDNYFNKNIKITFLEKNQKSNFTSFKLHTTGKYSIADKNISLYFVDKDILSLGENKIFFSKGHVFNVDVEWSFPAKNAYDISYDIYLTKGNKVIYDKQHLVLQSTFNNAKILTSPRNVYSLGIIASYSILKESSNGDISTKKQQIQYQPITFQTKQAFLKDINNNYIYDSIESIFTKDNQSIQSKDTDINGIEDALQEYALKFMPNKTFMYFDDTRDSDKDGMPDLLELSLGRDINNIDFLGLSEPEVLVKNPNKTIYKTPYESVNDFITITAKDGKKDISSLLKAYNNKNCFNKDKLSYFIATSKCQPFNIETIKDRTKVDLFWTVIDSDYNIAYKKQTIFLFIGHKKLDFQIDKVKSSIFSKDEKIIFRTLVDKNSKKKMPLVIDLAKIKIPKTDVNNSTAIEQKIYKYTNNIFHFQVLRLTSSTATFIIPQILPLKKDDKLRIFKNDKWQDFNLSANNSILYSKGFNKTCNISMNQYNNKKENSYCIAIKAVDGSENDADGKKDGIFTFYGGIASDNEFIKFDTKLSPGCSTLNAKDFNDTQKNKSDPMLFLYFLITCILTFKIFIKSKPY